MTRWIAVDWGTSQLRLWAIDANRAVIGTATSDDGMGRLSPAEFEPAFLRAAGGLLPARGATLVLICGMAGARAGWKEATYAAVPCAPVAPPMRVLANDPRLNVHILPGLSQSAPPDVMRGEETQIAGLLAQNPTFDGVICLPGTHTKWVRVADGQIQAFHTAMTGELFDLITHHSTLAAFTSEGWDDDAFDAEVARTRARPQISALGIFTLRAEGLLTGHAPGVARARLSGRLIGAEVATYSATWPGLPVTVLGTQNLSLLYARTLSAFGVESTVVNSTELTLAGLKAAQARYAKDLL